jgi:Flp pilus assembly pilin Flp
MKTTVFFFANIPFVMMWPQTEEGQDVAEYALILAVVVLLVVVTVRILGSSSTNIFSTVGSSITQ